MQTTAGARLAILAVIICFPLASGVAQEQALKIRGKVVDRVTEKPVEQARVQVLGMRRRGGGPQVIQECDTGPDGAFNLEVAHPGRRRLGLSIAASGYVRKLQTLQVGDPRELLIRLEKGQTLRGVVIDKGSSRPVAGARVVFNPQEAIADAEGRFELSGLPSEFEDAAVEITAPGYAVSMYPGPVPESADHRVTVVLEKAHVLGVEVRDDAGKPLEGIRVRARLPFAAPYSALERRNFTGVTDAAGVVTLKGLPPGRAYIVEAASSGAIATQSMVAASRPAGDPGEDVVLVLSPGRNAAIRVEDTKGMPLSGARIHLQPVTERRQAFQGYSEDETTRGPFRHGTTDESGLVAFDLLPASPVTCEVRKPGFQTVMVVLDPVAGPPAHLRVQMERDPNPPGTQIPWRGGLVEAFREAEQNRLPVMIQMTMDGERANDYMAGHHFKDPEVVRVAREIPILLASAFGPGGIVVEGVDHRIENGVSSRYGHVHPSVYQKVERYARENLVMLENFQVPREIFITCGGRELIHRTYYLTERDLVRLMLRAARFTQTELPLRFGRQRLAPLVRSLGAADPAVRSKAIAHLVLLANSRDEHARGLLLDLPGMGVDAHTRRQILMRLVLSSFRYPTAGLRGFARDPNPAVRKLCYERLGSLSEDQDLIALFARRLRRETEEWSVLCKVAGIAETNGILTVERVTEGERWRLLEALVCSRGPGAVMVSSAMLGELPATGLNQVLRTMARSGDVGAFIDLLGDLGLDSHDDVPRLRALAIALPRIRSAERLEEVQTVFQLASRSSNPLVREEAARTLGLRPEVGTLEGLQEMLKDVNLHVRFQAACSLMRRGDHAGISVLAEGLASGGVMADRACESLWMMRRTAESLDAWQWRQWLEESGFLEKAEDVQ